VLRAGPAACRQIGDFIAHHVIRHKNLGRGGAKPNHKDSIGSPLAHRGEKRDCGDPGPPPDHLEGADA